MRVLQAGWFDGKRGLWFFVRQLALLLLRNSPVCKASLHVIASEPFHADCAFVVQSRLEFAAAAAF